ncbi:hypothetical protein FB451DRAFT_1446851 [Mycena latifolia]|nr:hypothetical protein FB451DRAFT_1446851 [Mycena latifolia]
MRGAQRPDKVKWTRPCPRPLTPLSDSAALQVFIDIADSDHDDACVRKLLEYTGNLPLAVSLMANVAGYEGCERTLSRWEKESTRLLSDGYDQRSSLDISIMLSFSSPRMNSGAQELLGLLSMLPDGLSDADLIHSRLPIPNILSCKAILIQACLAYMDTTGNTPRLTSLVPIREHIRGAYPPSPELKRHLRKHFHHILRRGTPGLWWIRPENLPQVKNVLGNCHNLLADALSNPEECPDMDEVIVSVIDLNASMRHAGIGGSQLIDHVSSHLVGRPASSSHRLYSIEILRDRSRPLREIEAYIGIATRYFENTSDEEKGQWNFTIGCFYSFNQDYHKSIHYCQIALSHIINPTSPLHSQILNRMAIGFSILGDHSRGLALAQKAKELTSLWGDPAIQASATEAEARCQINLGNFVRAKILCEQAKELAPAESKHGYEELLADVLLTKTEYSEARAAALAVLRYRASCVPPIRDTVVTHINLALIEIATGSEVTLIESHMDNAYRQCTTFVLYPPGLAYCELMAAHLYLPEGKISLAREKFKKCLATFQNSRNVEGIRSCLGALLDMSSNMHYNAFTFRWAVSFLALGMASKNMLATVSALHFIGEIYAAEGNDGLALPVLSASLHGFTLMDIHHQRAKCMMQLGSIFERHGEFQRSVEWWQKARPLLESSSQVADMAKLDGMLHAAGNMRHGETNTRRNEVEQPILLE